MTAHTRRRWPTFAFLRRLYKKAFAIVQLHPVSYSQCRTNCTLVRSETSFLQFIFNVSLVHRTQQKMRKFVGLGENRSCRRIALQFFAVSLGSLLVGIGVSFFSAFLLADKRFL